MVPWLLFLYSLRLPFCNRLRLRKNRHIHILYSIRFELLFLGQLEVHYLLCKGSFEGLLDLSQSSLQGSSQNIGDFDAVLRNLRCERWDFAENLDDIESREVKSGVGVLFGFVILWGLKGIIRGKKIH